MKKTISLFILGLLIVVGGQFASAIAPEGDVTGFITEGSAEQAINTSVDTAYLLSVGGLFLVNDNFAVWNDAIIDIAASVYNDDPTTPSVIENAANGLFVGSLGVTDNTQKTICADDAGKLVLCATPAPLSCGSTKIDWATNPYNWNDGAVYFDSGAGNPTIVAFCGTNHDLSVSKNINTNASSNNDACLTPSDLFTDSFGNTTSPTATQMFYEASTTTGQWNMITIQRNGVITNVATYYGDLYMTTGGTCSGAYAPCGQATDEASCQNICSNISGSGAVYNECNSNFTIPACTWAQCS